MFKNNKGFSLIEILVTVGLVAILASVAIPSYQGYKKNTIKMAMRADVANGQKVYAAKYAIDGDYCYTFNDVGLGSPADKGSSPIYKNKGFYGFGVLTAVSGGGACSLTLSDVQFISAGEYVCTGGTGAAPTANWDAKTKAWTCSGSGWTASQRAATGGTNAASCHLNTNTFKLGAYSNSSGLNTFIQVNEQGNVTETEQVNNCQ